MGITSHRHDLFIIKKDSWIVIQKLFHQLYLIYLHSCKIMNALTLRKVGLNMDVCNNTLYTYIYYDSFNRLKISSRICFLAQAFELLSVDRLQG